MTSEFGKGLTYCLGLFLAHTDRINSDLEVYKKIGSNHAYGMWFYGAADHLYDFQSDSAPNELLKNRCKKFYQKCLSLRLPMEEKEQATKEDYYWAIQEAKDLLRLIDQANGIETEKGDWE